MDTFDRLGAGPWACRGRRELRATGRTRRRPQDRDAPLLTPQESQIARLAAADSPTKRSLNAFTCRPGRSAVTSTGCSPSSASRHAPRCATRSRRLPIAATATHNARADAPAARAPSTVAAFREHYGGGLPPGASSVHARLSHKAIWKSCRALAEVDARAAGRDDVATAPLRVTAEMVVFGARPYRNDPASSPGVCATASREAVA